MQANLDNRKRVIDKVDKINTTEIADYGKALTVAFELLRDVNTTAAATGCNQAIMLIGDGSPDTYEEIFQQYNWPERRVKQNYDFNVAFQCL